MDILKSARGSVTFSLLSLVWAGTALAAAYNGPPGGPASAAENEAIFNQYCVGNPNTADIPEVNYANSEVQDAIQKMAGVKDKNYYFYAAILRAYKLGKNGALSAPPANAPKELSPGGHAFLVQLCGEFRDRATLIRERIQWLRKLYKLPTTVPAAYDPAGDPWAQMSAQWYGSYTQLSSAYYYAKKQELVDLKQDRVVFGKHDEDAPVEGTDGCETKYIFSEYVSKGKIWDGLPAFRAAYQPFKAQYCNADDVSFYYDFRGDKNFKQNSPEGNAMIWTAGSIASQCSSPTTAKAGSPLSDADCSSYFIHPFLTRWNGARAGLATWLFRDPKYNDQFETENGKLTMLFNAKDMTEPFHFLMGGVTGEISEMLTEFTKVNDPFARGDMGYNDVTGASILASPNWNIDLHYERLRDAVNTHTNWYGSGYDDKLPGGIVQTQFYSPFVASSYEMSASDGFATEQDGGRKAWMFIFKVKKENWYNTQSIVARKPINFDTQWLDETTLGTQGFAESERAFDRLGTSIEGEHVAVLYLHNILDGQAISDDLTDEEVKNQLELAQNQFQPGVEIKKAELTTAEGVALKLEFQGAPQCWSDTNPDGTVVQNCNYNPAPIWLTLTGATFTPTSVVEATLTYQGQAPSGQPAPAAVNQTFVLSAAAGGLKGYAKGYGEDAYASAVTLTVKVDGKPLTFGPGPVFTDSAVLDFKKLVPPPVVP